MKSSLYHYLDYRKFLKDRFKELKKENPNFSYRFFNRLAGIKSAGFLKLVMDGKRGLGAEGIRKIILGLKLDPQEARYFDNLVRFNQAQTHQEKDLFFQELSAHRGSKKIKEITEAQYHLLSRWYYPAILELLRLNKPSKKDATWLSEKLKPQVGLREVKQALKEITKLGLVKKSPAGYLSLAHSMLTTPDEVNSVAATNYHLEMNKLAALALNQDAKELREFSGLTSAVSPETFQKIKTEIQKFRRRLHSVIEEADSEKEKEIIAQVNLHLFTLNG